MRRSRTLPIGLWWVFFTSSCGSGGGDRVDSGPVDAPANVDADTTETASAVVGPEGGSVELADGAGVEIPPGALDQDVTITVSTPSAGYAQLPAVASGRVYAFEPHGQVFLAPVTITIPHQGNPEELALFISSPGSDWDKLAHDKTPTALRAQVTHFSYLFNGREVCGLYRQECCDTDGGAEVACAGDALHCVDGRCLECGLESDPCCGGVGGTCLDPDRLECTETYEGTSECTVCGFERTPCCGGAGGTCRSGELTCYSAELEYPPYSHDQCLECGLRDNPCCGGPGGTCDSPWVCLPEGGFGSICAENPPDAGSPPDAAATPDAPPIPDAAAPPDAAPMPDAAAAPDAAPMPDAPPV